jgi:hypothetical protein
MDKDIFDNNLLFYGLDDFVTKRNIIKAILPTKTIKEQYIYKLYFYSRPFISETWKDLMWDYLHGDLTELEFMCEYGPYKRKHQSKD